MAQVVQDYQRSEVRDGMRIDWHVPIPMDDGIILRADVYRPIEEGQYPAIMTYGPYAKGLSFQEAYTQMWGRMAQKYPEVPAGSTNQYQNWEVVDPEKWVPHGYICVRVDSRGAGWSPGVIEVWSAREAKDFHDCIEWAAEQAWSNGKIGLCGISYYAINQWHVAGLQPPHLAAMVPWEGAADFYRDITYHGGILCEFFQKWYPRQVDSVQYGLGERARKSRVTGESVAGPVTLSEQELKRVRIDPIAQIKAHPLDDEWHRSHSANWPNVKAPFLSCGNWGGHGLHLRGNTEAFTQSASEQKWLEIHGASHWEPFYTDRGRALQRRFFDYFLKGEQNGWDQEPRVLLEIRHPGERFVERKEHEWPLARTQWTKLYLDAASTGLSRQPVASESKVEYEALGDGVLFQTPPFEQETEITGPLAAKLFVSSSTKDADLFLVVQLFDPNGQEVTFHGAVDPNSPIAHGWLRASQRKLDPAKSLPDRPYHAHDEEQPLTPGEVYEVDVEIWPTCIVVPAGYRLALAVRGKDYEYKGELDEWARTFVYAGRGVGPFPHDDLETRPRDVFGGKVSLHTGGGRESYLLLPVIPPKE